MFGEISEKPMSSTTFLAGDLWYTLPYKYQDIFYTNTEMACLYKPKGYAISVADAPPLEFDLKLNLLIQGVALGLADPAYPTFYQRFERLVPGIVWFKSKSLVFPVLEMYYDLIFRSIPFKEKQFSVLTIDIPFLLIRSSEFNTTLPSNLLAVIASCAVDIDPPTLNGSVFIENI